MALATVPTCVVSENGVFKYIAISATASDGSTKTLIRGLAGYPYHADIFRATTESLAAAGLRLRPLGGGRMRRSGAHNEVLFIYGYSQAYGQADHALTMALVRESMPDIKEVTWSNEGY